MSVDRDVVQRSRNDNSGQRMHICKKSNSTGTTCGAGSTYPSGAHGFTPVYQWGSCCSIISFLCNVLQIVVCRLALFLLAIMFSVLRITASDYTFGIFKLFIACIIQYVFPYKSYFHSVYFSQLATKVQQMQFSLTVKVSERVLFNIKSAIFTLFFLKDEVG